MKKEELLKRLETIKKLEDNWDNYGADPINETVIKNTKILIDNLRILPDFIAPLQWGAIQLEWERKNLNESINDIYIEIEVCLPEYKGSKLSDSLSVFIMITDKESLTHEINKVIPFESYNLLNDVIEFFLK